MLFLSCLVTRSSVRVSFSFYSIELNLNWCALMCLSIQYNIKTMLSRHLWPSRKGRKTLNYGFSSRTVYCWAKNVGHYQFLLLTQGDQPQLHGSQREQKQSKNNSQARNFKGAYVLSLVHLMFVLFSITRLESNRPLRCQAYIFSAPCVGLF